MAAWQRQSAVNMQLISSANAQIQETNRRSHTHISVHAYILFQQKHTDVERKPHTRRHTQFVVDEMMRANEDE